MWKIWYVGLTTAEGTTPEEWAAAPDDGVLCVAVRFGFNQDGVMLGEVFSGSDWYWMHENCIAQNGACSATPGEWLPHGAPEDAVLKKGRWTDEAEVEQASEQMMAWVTAAVGYDN
jgi:hypothetical protein